MMHLSSDRELIMWVMELRICWATRNVCLADRSGILCLYLKGTSSYWYCFLSVKTISRTEGLEGMLTSYSIPYKLIKNLSSPFYMFLFVLQVHTMLHSIQ